ncbi:MAG: molecular chaperone TorD family protein [Vicinamibacterales bacterium]|nr:molecular chaperone TorD family protein [Vicinamibacterales bacterium]
MSADSPDERDAMMRALLRGSAEWRLLSRLFECPSDAWRADLEALARELPEGELRTAVAEAGVEAGEGLFHSVFGPGGPAPPREVSYHDTLELGTLMSALVSHYEAFDYRPGSPEPPDHLAVEVGFVAYLYLKEAFAVATADPETAALTARVRERFVREHLAMMAEPIAGLLAASGVSYLARASALLAARVGSRPRAPGLPVIQPVLDDEEDGGFTCAS